MLPPHMCAASAVHECVKQLSEDDCVSRKPHLMDARPGALAGPGCSAPSGSPNSTAKDFRELPSDADLYQGDAQSRHRMHFRVHVSHA